MSSVRASVVVGMSPPSVAGALREVFDADAKSLARALDSRDASTTTCVGLALDVLVSHAANDLDAVFEPSLERVVACRGARCTFVALASAPSVARGVGAALEARLGTRGDKRALLAACAATRAIANGESVDVRAVFEGETILRALLDVAREGDARAPTRLHAEAADAFAELSARACAPDASTSTSARREDELRDAIDVRRAFVDVVKSWARDAGGRGLFVECCEKANDALECFAVASASADDETHAMRSRASRDELYRRAWSTWAPAFVTVATKKSEKKMMRELELAFDAATETTNRNSGRGVAHALITVGLYLGRIGVDHGNREVLSSMVSEDTAKKLDTMLQTYTGTALAPALHSADDDAQSIAATLLGIVLAPDHLGWTDRCESLLDGVLPLVEETGDVVSLGFARLVGGLIARDPRGDAATKMLQMCGSTARSAKLSALRVLTEMVRCGGSTMDASSLDAVVRSVLPRFQDEDLDSRRAAAEVFARVDSSRAFPVLINLLDSKDARERSAASDAIVATLRRGACFATALGAYLTAILYVASSSSSERDDAGRASIGGAAARAIEALPRVAEKVNANEWPSVVDTVTSAVFETPASSALIQAVTALMPWMGTAPSRARVIRACRHRLKSQTVDKGDDEREVFDRLAPLLILCALPLDAWNDSSEDVIDVRTILRRRMLNVRGEFEDARRVSAELCGRQPRETLDDIVATSLREALGGARENADDLARVRSCMFCCASALAVRGDIAMSHDAKDALRSACVDALAWTSSKEDPELTKAHMGAMETLASLVVAEIMNHRDDEVMKTTSKVLLEPSAPVPTLSPKTSSGRALIVELDDEPNSARRERTECELETLSGVLHLACSTAESIPHWVYRAKREDLSTRLAMMNVLIAANARPLGVANATLMRACFPALVACAERRCEPEIRVAALQALMVAHHSAKDGVDEARAVELARVSTNILRDHAAGDAARMGATKVATALLSSPDRVLEAIGVKHLHALRDGLETAARLAADGEVSALAAKLARCITTPNADFGAR